MIPSAEPGDTTSASTTEPPRNIRDVPGEGPTVLRIMVGAELRRLREAAGVTRDEAGEVIRGSQAKMSRLELGRVGFKERDVVDLLALFGVTDPAERERLLELARRANEPGWWRDYHDLLPSWFEQYLGLEQAAAQIRTYESHFVPGLLQTEEMIRHVTELRRRKEDAEEIERRIRLRRDRQRVLTRPEDPTTLWAVLDEAVLRRPTGGADCMVRQIDHLLEMAQLRNVVLQIIPFDHGAHAGLGGPFSIVRFTGTQEVPDVVYLEQLNSALYLDKRSDVDEYLATMEQLCMQAMHPRATLERLVDLRDEHKG